MADLPSNLYSDGVAPVRRSRPGEVFFIRLQACPEPGSDDFGEAGGAFVNCYLDEDDLRSAELRAIDLLQENGWRPERFDAWKLIHAEEAEDSPAREGAPSVRALVEQALLDGQAGVFYCWPIDAPDAQGPAA